MLDAVCSFKTEMPLDEESNVDLNTTALYQNDSSMVPQVSCCFLFSIAVNSSGPILSNQLRINHPRSLWCHKALHFLKDDKPLPVLFWLTYSWCFTFYYRLWGYADISWLNQRLHCSMMGRNGSFRAEWVIFCSSSTHVHAFYQYICTKMGLFVFIYQLALL